MKNLSLYMEISTYSCPQILFQGMKLTIFFSYNLESVSWWLTAEETQLFLFFSYFTVTSIFYLINAIAWVNWCGNVNMIVMMLYSSFDLKTITSPNNHFHCLKTFLVLLIWADIYSIHTLFFSIQFFMLE